MKPSKTHLLLFSPRIFFLFDFARTSQQVLKVHKVPRSAFRYVWGIQGNGAVVASTTQLQARAGSIDRREISPSMYVRNLRQGKDIENILNVGPNGTAQNGFGRGRCDPLSCGRSWTINHSCWNFLMQDLNCWSAIPVRTQPVLPLLTSTWQSHVSL